jgi:hypothetical protein
MYDQFTKIPLSLGHLFEWVASMPTPAAAKREQEEHGEMGAVAVKMVSTPCDNPLAPSNTKQWVQLAISG